MISRNTLDRYDALIAGAAILLILIIAGMTRGQGLPPPAPVCYTPAGYARPCEWYERSYGLPKEQQEQILRAILTAVAGRYGLTMPETNTAPALEVPPVDPFAEMLSTAEVAAQFGTTRSRVQQLASSGGIPIRRTVRGGVVVRVFTDAEVAEMKARRGKVGYPKGRARR